MHTSIQRLTRGFAVACALVCLAIGFASRPAHAQAGYYTYTLNNVTFGGPSIDYFGSGTASGYFDYDPTTNTIGQYDITTNAQADYNGDPFGGFEYDNADSSGIFAAQYPGSTAVTFGETPDDVVFYLNFSDLQPNAVLRTAEGYGFGTSLDFSASREGDTGTLTVTPAASAVPELSPLAAIGLLSALGCAALGVAGAKRRRGAR